MPRRQRNFHVPLSVELHAELRTQAAASNIPATALARQAIAHWLRVTRRGAVRLAIASYAGAAAGTDADLDRALEAAAIAELVAELGGS